MAISSYLLNSLSDLLLANPSAICGGTPSAEPRICFLSLSWEKGIVDTSLYIGRSKLRDCW